MRTKSIPILIAAAALTCSALAGEYVVIVNKASSVADISKADLARIFTGKKTDLGGAAVVPISQTPESPVAASFLDEVCKMTPDKYKDYWVQAQVKGMGSAPMIQKSSDAVIAIVSQIPGAVGYVEKGKETDAVKVISVK